MAMKTGATGSEQGREQPQGSRDDAPGRTYFISIPAVSGHLTEDQLERISMNLAVYGTGVVLVGLVGLLFPLLFTLAIPKLIGWLLILGGGMSLLQFLLMCGAPGMTSFLLLGSLHMLAGLWIVVRPVHGGSMFILILSCWFLLHGLIKLLMAGQLRSIATWPSVMAAGVLSAVLAFTVLFLTPRFGLVFLAIAFGADLVASGAGVLLIACTAFLGRRAATVSGGATASGVREPLMHQAAASA